MSSKEKPNPFGSGVEGLLRVEGECRSTDGNCGAKDATEHATEEVFSNVEEHCKSENAEKLAFCDPQEHFQQFRTENGAMEEATVDELKLKKVDRLLEELGQEVDQLMGLPLNTSNTDKFTLSSDDEDNGGRNFFVASRKQPAFFYTQTGSPEQELKPKNADCFLKEMKEEVSKGFVLFKTTGKENGIESSKDNDLTEEANKENRNRFPENICEPSSTSDLVRPLQKPIDSGFQSTWETPTSKDVLQSPKNLPESHLKAIDKKSDEQVATLSRRVLAHRNLLEPEEEEVFVKPPNWLDPQLLRSVPQQKKSTNPFEPCQPDTFFGKLHQNSPLTYMGHEEEPMDKKEKVPSHSRKNLLQVLKQRKIDQEIAWQEAIARAEMMESLVEKNSPSGENAPMEVREVVKTIEEQEVQDSRSSLEVPHMPACHPVVEPIFAKETDSPSHGNDSDPAHCKDSPLHSKDFPSHSQDSLSHSKESPSNSKESPSNSKDSPSNSMDTPPSSYKGSATSHIRDSISSHIKDSPNSHSKDSIALHSKDSSPGGKALRDSKALEELSGEIATDKPKATQEENMKQEENKEPEENNEQKNKKKPEDNKEQDKDKKQEHIIELYDPEFPALATTLPIKELNVENLDMIRGMPSAKTNHMNKWLYSQSFNDKDYEQEVVEALPEYSLIDYSDSEEEEETEQMDLVSDPADNLDALIEGFQSLQLNEAIPECCLTDSVFLVDKPQTAISLGFMLPPMPLKESCSVNDFLKIRVTHVYTPFQFWFNFVDRSYDTSTLNEIQTEMGKFYYDRDNTDYLTALPCCLIKAGYICAIQLENEWRRVRVVSTPPPGVDTVSIYYVDFGYGEDVSAADLRYLANIFGEKPELAVRGTLSYIHPLGPHWSPDSMVQFQRLVSGQELFAHVTELDLKERIVFLRISLNEEFLPSVNKMLVEANLAGRSQHYDLKQIENNVGRRHRYLRERLPSHEMLETGVFPVLDEEFEVAFDAIIYSPSFEKFKVPRMKKGYAALHQALVAWMPAFRQQIEEWAAVYNEAKAKVRLAQDKARLAWLSRVEKAEMEIAERQENRKAEKMLQEAKEGAAEEENEKSIWATEEEEEIEATQEEEEIEATEEEEETVMTTIDDDETPPAGNMDEVD